MIIHKKKTNANNWHSKLAMSNINLTGHLHQAAFQYPLSQINLTGRYKHKEHKVKFGH